MKNVKIWIGEEYDGFTIEIISRKTGKAVTSLRIDQEDSIEALQEIFQRLGYETDFEEVC